MNVAAGLICFFLGLTASRETVVTYHYAAGTLTIRHFSDMTSNGIDKPKQGEPTQKHANFVGDLAELEFAERGIKAVGKVFDCRWEPGEAKKVTLNHTSIDGSATLTFDSEVAFRAQTALLKPTDKPLETPMEWNRVQVDSQRILYDGDATNGVMQMELPWKLHRDTRGDFMKTVSEMNSKTGKALEHLVKIHFEQTLDCSGSRGDLHVGLGETGELDQLNSGHFDGPVHFSMTRRETTVGTNEVHTSSYVGVADRLDIDMVHLPRQITALGHVKVDALSDGDPSNIVVDRFVIIVDKKMEPIGYRLGSGTERTQTKDGSK